jgi:hypothetical protein
MIHFLDTSGCGIGLHPQAEARICVREDQQFDLGKCTTA